MQLKHAKDIMATANNMGIELTLHEGYSGRGMYGKETVGIVGSLGEIVQCIAATASNLT